MSDWTTFLRERRVALRACGAIAVFFPACYFAFAQPPVQPPAKVRRPAPPADCRETPVLDPVINRGPRPAQELKAFAKEVTSNDAQFEVFVGQGRLLTLKADMVDPKKQSPLIATGDPSII